MTVPHRVTRLAILMATIIGVALLSVPARWPQSVPAAPSSAIAPGTAPTPPCASAGPVASSVAAPSGTPTVGTPSLSVDFDAWLDRYHATPEDRRRELIPEGQVLAARRRSALLALFTADPERALTMALAPERRALVPAAVAPLVERSVAGIGDLAVLVETGADGARKARLATIGGERFLAHVHGRLRTQPSLTAVPLRGIAIANDLALHDDPVPAQALATRRQAISASVGPAAASGSDPVSGSGSSLPGAAPAPAPARPVPDDDPSWTHGAKRVLYMRVDFADMRGDPVDVQTAVDSLARVDAFWRRSSIGLSGCSGTVIPVTLPMVRQSWYYANSIITMDDLFDEALAAARDAGYDPDAYDLWICAHPRIASLPYGGKATVMGRKVWLNGSFVPRLVAHELTHTLGVDHANTSLTSDGTVFGAGTVIEYGNIFDIMGDGGNLDTDDLSLLEKFQLYWAGLPQQALASGTFRVFAHDGIERGPHEQMGLVIPRRNDPFSRQLWIEFRQRFDPDRFADDVRGNWVSLDRLANTVQVSYYGWDPNAAAGHQLLDTVPGSTPQGSVPGMLDELDEVRDAGLDIGRTITDPLSDIHITPVRKHPAAGPLPAAMDVVVKLGPFPGNRAPIATLVANRRSAAVGEELTFRVDASDPDGDALAYFWTFGDDTVGLNQPTMAKTWSEGRIATVTVVVSDMKGQTTTVSTEVVVVDPAILRLRAVLVAGTAPSIAHEGVAGEEMVIKGVVDGAAATVIRSAEFSPLGDGVWLPAVVDNGTFEARFTPGQPFSGVGRIRVTGVTNFTSHTTMDDYPLIIHPPTAVTPEIRTNIAIEDGLWFLRKELQRGMVRGVPIAELDSGYDNIAATAIFLLGMGASGHRLLNDPMEDPYTDDIRQMINLIVLEMETLPALDKQDGTSPDANGNGVVATVDAFALYRFYSTPFALMALSSSHALDTLVDPTVHPGYSGKPLRTVVEDMVEWIGQEQLESFSNLRRGQGWWSYNGPTVDGSISGWIATALVTAKEQAGCSPSAFVVPLFESHIDQGRNADGSFGYQFTYATAGNLARTAGNLSSYALFGWPESDPRVVASKRFIADQWNNTRASSFPDANLDDFYAMFSLAKGARAFTPAITSFTSSAGETYEWYPIYRDHLLATRDPVSGHWDGHLWPMRGSGTRNLTTAMAVAILQPNLLSQAPVARAIALTPTVAPNATATVSHAQSYLTDPAAQWVGFAWDADGDGVFEFTTTDIDTPYTFTVGSSGTVTSTLRVTSVSGGVQRSAQATTTILVGPPDDLAPIALAMDIVVETDPDRASATVAPAQIDGGSSDPDARPLTFSLRPPGPFAIGANPVELVVFNGITTAVDGATITVVDRQPPSLALLRDVVVWAPPTAATVPVTFDVQATDNDPRPITVATTPASGSRFPIGTTVVTATTTDASGNTVSDSFSVIVKVLSAAFVPPTATTVGEDVGVVQVVVELSEPAPFPVTLSCIGTAGPGMRFGFDLSPGATLVTFAVDQQRAEIGFRVVDDRDAEATETATFTLGSLAEVLIPPAQATFRLSILDNDGGAGRPEGGNRPERGRPDVRPPGGPERPGRPDGGARPPEGRPDARPPGAPARPPRADGGARPDADRPDARPPGSGRPSRPDAARPYEVQPEQGPTGRG